MLQSNPVYLLAAIPEKNIQLVKVLLQKPLRPIQGMLVIPTVLLQAYLVPLFTPVQSIPFQRLVSSKSIIILGCNGSFSTGCCVLLSKVASVLAA